MNQPNPDCPHCRGTGRRVLFQLPEPCECTERVQAVEWRFVPPQPYELNWDAILEAYRRLGLEECK